MRFIVMFLFAMFFAATPAYLLDAAVMPQLDSISRAYGSGSETAEAVAGVR